MTKVDLKIIKTRVKKATFSRNFWTFFGNDTCALTIQAHDSSGLNQAIYTIGYDVRDAWEVATYFDEWCKERGIEATHSERNLFGDYVITTDPVDDSDLIEITMRWG